MEENKKQKNRNGSNQKHTNKQKGTKEENKIVKIKRNGVEVQVHLLISVLQ